MTVKIGKTKWSQEVIHFESTMAKSENEGKRGHNNCSEPSMARRMVVLMLCGVWRPAPGDILA